MYFHLTVASNNYRKLTDFLRSCQEVCKKKSGGNLPGSFLDAHSVIGPATRYLIAYERLAVRQAEYPGVRVLADPSWSPNLYGVAPRTADAP